MPAGFDGPKITGASKTAIDAALEDESRLMSFPDGIDRIVTLRAGMWIALERLHEGRRQPMSRLAEAVHWIATTSNENQHLDFEARLRRSFRTLTGYLVSQSIDPLNKPANR